MELEFNESYQPTLVLFWLIIIGPLDFITAARFSTSNVETCDTVDFSKHIRPPREFFRPESLQEGQPMYNNTLRT